MKQSDKDWVLTQINGAEYNGRSIMYEAVRIEIENQINTEDFIDSIVDRIKRKQLK